MTGCTHSIRVLLIDARPVVLVGLCDLINAQQPRMHVIGQASSYSQALELTDDLQPDVALFSFFPDALDPLAVISTLACQGTTKVLVLKGLFETVPISRAIEQGARGVVLAEDPSDSITRAITNVHENDIAADRAWTGGLNGYATASHAPLNGDAEHTKIANLTQRERELIRAIVSNPSAKYFAIAAQLNICEHTVHNHLSSIYHKLHLINRIDLLVYALKHGLADQEVPPESSWSELR